MGVKGRLKHNKIQCISRMTGRYYNLSKQNGVQYMNIKKNRLVSGRIFKKDGVVFYYIIQSDPMFGVDSYSVRWITC